MQNDWLTDQFELNRPRLRTMAHRMLGSPTEADDAVQEAWIRLHRAGADDVDNLGGWLTTIVARVCLDILRARRSRREDPVELSALDPHHSDTADPEQEALQADSVGLALLIVLDTLGPAERLAYVLHDMFGLSFEEVGSIVGRSPVAARQLASRARRRVQQAQHPDRVESVQRRKIVTAFLAASREGDFEGLLALLDPDVELTADAAAVLMGAPAVVNGRPAVATTFSGRAKAARGAVLNGKPGLVWMQGGSAKMAFAMTIADGLITRIEMVADGARLSTMSIEAL